MEFRIEKDTMGEVKVPANKYWGAQTERSRNNFKIGPEGSMPKEIIYAFAYLKKAAAHANHELGVLPIEKRDLIGAVCDEMLTGMHDGEFPLVIWQTGSGTQSNMNCNEVIANRGHVLTGGSLLDEAKALNPNDDVNKSQSSNDTYPTAMHIAAYKQTVEITLPGMKHLRDVLDQKAIAFKDIVKTGRTHFMDATPLTVGQEFSGYVSQLDHGLKAIKNSLEHLRGIDFLIYNAGMDPFEDGGGMRGITGEILEERERLVAQWCIDTQTPALFVLAGGYTSSKLDLDGLAKLHIPTIKEFRRILSNK